MKSTGTMTENNHRNDYLVGVDLGGTKILAGVFTPAFECVGLAKISTKSARGPKEVIDRLARCVRDAVDEADLAMDQVQSAAVGAPGTVDAKAGKVVFAPNLEWRDVPLKKELEQRLEIPVGVENDCNLATLGVQVVELKAKPSDLLGIFIGTGIGGGLILKRELYQGSHFSAGEIGHMVMDLDGPKCSCGNRGCLEALASRTAIFQQILTAIRNGEITVLTDILGDSLENMRSGDLRKAIRRGDKLVERVVTEAAQYIGVALANLANVLNPEMVVLGGGVIEALADDMMSVITEIARDYAMPGVLDEVEIISAKLGDHAGITGGAILAKRLK